jgi:hypothetical protein
VDVSQLIDPANKTSGENSGSYDTQNMGAVTLMALVGESGDTLNGSNHIQLEVEESDDDATWNDVADEDLVNTVSGDNTGTFAKIDDPSEDDATYLTSYIGSKRYVRVVTNLTGTHSSGTPMGVIALGTCARKKPQN